MRGTFRTIAAGLATLIAVAAVFSVCSSWAAGAGAKQTTGTAWVGVTHSEGKDLYVSGDIKDELLGRGAIVYVTRLGGGPEPGTVSIKARKVTIYTARGSLRGSGEALQTIGPNDETTVHDGVFELTKGTGAYKGHTLKGTFDGSYADGVYTFDYEAKYK